MSIRIDKKNVFLFILLALVLFFVFLKSQPDGKLHLVFCDVGQGDGILIQTPKGDQIVIDGGPDRKILDCLGDFVPFWDRKIEMVVLTHPQADHMKGLVEVLRRFEIDLVLSNKDSNSTEEFRVWSEELEEKQTEIHYAKKGDKLDLGRGVSIDVLWPQAQSQASFGQDLNENSIILKILWGETCAYLTGDAGFNVLNQLLTARKCQILKIAHHGSKTGLDKTVLEKFNPKVAVISVGRNNHFGHPHRNVLGLLEKDGVKILRTDQDGTIELVSDKANWYIK